MISVRSEVQILPGPPPNDAQRRSCRAATAVAQQPREPLGAERGFSGVPVDRGSSARCGLPRLLTHPLPPARHERREAALGRGCSSVGRAPALQAGGHRFDSVHLHHRPNGAKRYSCRAASAIAKLSRERPGAEKGSSQRLTRPIGTERASAVAGATADARATRTTRSVVRSGIG